MPSPRDTTVDELSDFDVGCRITLRRPVAEPGTRAVLVGKLLSIEETTKFKGMMPKPAYRLSLELPGYWSSTEESFGPFSPNHPVKVGTEWIDRPVKSFFVVYRTSGESSSWGQAVRAWRSGSVTSAGSGSGSPTRRALARASRPR